MANIIAVIWDFDKTLVAGYMQDPIFKKYGVDSGPFWKEVNALPQKYMTEQGVRVNRDTIYLNHFINSAHNGTFPGLNNEILKDLGAELSFYNGIPEVFQKAKAVIENDQSYIEYDIKVEHYIVSTGMAQMIKGSSIMPFVDGIWGCELIEAPDKDNKMLISEIGYTIDNTSKTRALFEINKGVPKRDGVDVNSRVPEDMRRVHFKNMIYIADGPSDIPAFSVINKNGGSTFAVYPRGDREALQQVEKLREDGRINMYAEADYSEGTTALMWIENKIITLAKRIRDEEKTKLSKMTGDLPKHLTD
jgi:hypothetical protein